MEVLKKLESTIDKMRSAIENGDVDAVRALLTAGYAKDALIRDRYSAVHLAVISKAATQILPILAGAGFDMSAYDTNGQTPLHWAIDRAGIEVCKLLLDAGASVLVRDNMEATLLFPAAQLGMHDVCEILINAGIDVNASNAQSYTALHMAAWNEQVDVCRLLVAAGASPSWMPELPSDDYLTPFQNAVKYAAASTARYFVQECNERLDQRTIEGRSLDELVDGNRRAMAVLEQLRQSLPENL
jgi:ankyrin repeat protein